MEKRKIEHSIRITNDLALKSLANKNKQFAFFPESLGIVYGNNANSWGFLIREMVPKPFAQGQRQLIPLFALYSANTLEKDESALLVELIERSNMDPATYVLEKIIYPILKCWADGFVETGVLIEAHGQNTCLEIDENMNPQRIVFRDFDTHVNKEIRQRKGLTLHGLNPYEVFTNEDTSDTPQGAVMSVLFDQAMRVPFDRIASLLKEKYNVPEKVLQLKVKKFLRDVFPEGDLYFPKNGQTYNYSPGVLGVGAKAKLMTTAEPPAWR